MANDYFQNILTCQADVLKLFTHELHESPETLLPETEVGSQVLGRLSEKQISEAFQRALRVNGMVTEEDTSVVFYDLSFLDQRLEDLVRLFPANTLHGIAIKANPLQRILRKLNTKGLGVEAASLPELHLAINAGFPVDRIVFDSPTKTKAELEYALRLGVHINIDSMAELARVESLLRDRQVRGTIGVRINPQVGIGKILATSVAGDYSKFGIPLNEYRQELKEAFLSHEWLSGVHLHIGSQGCPMEILLTGIERVLDFVREVNSQQLNGRQSTRIKVVDLGGGLPVSYHHDHLAVSMTEYQDALNRRFPELFTNRFKLITEFGRYIYANTGWVASRVEYVKRGPSINTAMIHVGADMFLRECYNPQDWHHEICVLDQTGKLKTGVDSVKYAIAGPLCFGGDVIAKEITLPVIEPGDYVVIQDSGAYTLSMWSRYNSRQMPKVVGYYNQGSRFETLKEKEAITDILRFWA